MAKPFSEADMYGPVKEFFTGLGYSVHGEVKDCDVAMRKDGALVIIELKKAFNVTLLYQAVDRQKITSQVYVAIPRPRRTKTRDAARMREILKKLEIGLIYVNMDGIINSVEIIAFPPAALKTGGKKRRDGILSEMEGRSVDLNRGGQTGKPLATAYREKAVKIACLLEVYGALKAKELVAAHGCDKNTRDILAKNFYGWFEKAGNGHYGLSAEGVRMLLDESAGGDFCELIKLYRSQNIE